MSEQDWGCLDKISEVNFSPAETLLVVSSFNFFQKACMVYKHAVVAAFRIYAQHGEVVAKRGGWSLFIK